MARRPSRSTVASRPNTWNSRASVRTQFRQTLGYDAPARMSRSAMRDQMTTWIARNAHDPVHINGRAARMADALAARPQSMPVPVAARPTMTQRALTAANSRGGRIAIAGAALAGATYLLTRGARAQTPTAPPTPQPRPNGGSGSAVLGTPFFSDLPRDAQGRPLPGPDRGPITGHYGAMATFGGAAGLGVSHFTGGRGGRAALIGAGLGLAAAGLRRALGATPAPAGPAAGQSYTTQDGRTVEGTPAQIEAWRRRRGGTGSP